jgi:HEAT repeat protein
MKSEQTHKSRNLVEWLLQKCLNLAIRSNLKKLKSPDSSVRAKFARETARMGATVGGVPPEPFVPLLDDEDSKVRASAILGLTWLGYAKNIVPQLLKALDDEDSEIRTNAARALKVEGNPQVITALTKALSDKVPSVRSEATTSLGFIGDASVLPAIQALENDNSKVWPNVVRSGPMKKTR